MSAIADLSALVRACPVDWLDAKYGMDAEPSDIADQLYAAIREEKATAPAATATPELLPKADVVAWLTKKAREQRARGPHFVREADTISVLASKAERGAIRPDNLRMLPADFFEPGHAYTHRNGHDFHCVAVTTHPQTGELLAMGWHIDGWGHAPAIAGTNQWRHEYDGVQAPAGTEGGDR